MTSTARTKRNLPIIKRLNVFVRHVLFVTARRYQLFVGEAETICHSAPPFTLLPRPPARETPPSAPVASPSGGADGGAVAHGL